MSKNKSYNDINYTRYIMSWVRAGGHFSKLGEGYDDFRNWLKYMGIPEDTIDEIVARAMNGKMELEMSAKKFLANE